MRYGDHRSGYPDSPGYRRQETSRAAAEAIAPREKSLRARVFDALKIANATPEEMAERLGEAVHSIRPRFSQLLEAGLIEDTGERGTAMGGRKSIRWRVKDEAKR